MYSLVEKVLFLQNVDLLSSTRSEDLALLSSIAQEVVYPEGSLIFKEEELADALYVILRGRVSLSKGGQQLVTVGEKEALGTWGLFEAEPRVMSARAAEESLLLKVDREDFYDLLLDYPELGQSILKALVRRLRKLIDRAGP